MEKAEQIKEIVHIIFSEQCSGLPHKDMGSGRFIIEGGLSIEVIRQIAEQVYRQGYRKGVSNEV